MINVSTITQQLVEWLEDDINLQDCRVSRGEFVNEDPSLAVNGWLGMYRRSVDYDPRNLGVPPNNYEGDFVFMVLVQRTSFKSGQACEDALEGMVKNVLDRVVQVPRNYIDHFSDIVVDYTYIETDRKTMHFQGALLTFTTRISIEVE